jgi:hypothetical protein
MIDGDLFSFHRVVQMKYSHPFHIFGSDPNSARR